jgi:hypothetical protein
MSKIDLQIKEWKNRYGEVHLIEVPTDDVEPLKGYFKKPNLDTLSASAKIADSDPVRAGMVMFENCWLGGDDAIKTNDEAKLSCIKALGTLIKIREASIKKL